jgi:phage gpG-like protein
MNVLIDFKLDDYIHKLNSAAAALAKPQELLGSIGTALVIKNRDRHDKGLAPDGTPWKPLARSTMNAYLDSKIHKLTKIASKTQGARSSLSVAAKLRSGRRVLREHGDLLRGLYYQVDGNSVQVIMSDPKAKFHQEGTKPYVIRPKVAKALGFGGIARMRVNHPGLPARPLLGFPDGDKDKVTATVDDYVGNLFRKG